MSIGQRRVRIGARRREPRQWSGRDWKRFTGEKTQTPTPPSSSHFRVHRDGDLLGSYARYPARVAEAMSLLHACCRGKGGDRAQHCSLKGKVHVSKDHPVAGGQ